MAGVASITSAATTATSLANLIVVTANSVVGYQPQNGSSLLNQTPVAQPPSLVFNYEGEQTVTIESDITDHYVEDNTAVQDQIALRPEIITTHGFVGELNDIAPPALQFLQAAASALTTISPYLPDISVSALIAYNEATFAYNVAANAINTGVAAWSSINGGGGQTVLNLSSQINTTGLQSKQAVYFQQFYAYWQNRVLFTVQTPWGVFANCAIRTLRAIQDETTNVITDFDVSFKVMRFAQTLVTSASQQGRLGAQASPLINGGTSTPASSISVGTGLASNFPTVA